MVELDFVTRLLFVGIWNFADDDGFIEYTPKRIKMQVFPADALDVSGALRSLLESGQLTEYISDQGPLLKVTNWERHQRVSHKADTKFTGIQRVSSGVVRRIPEPSALKGIEGNREKTSSPPVTDSDFADAWDHWPKKVERKKAFEKFKVIARRRGLDVIVADIIRFGDAYGLTTAKQFVPALGVWLGGERWTDELPAASNVKPGDDGDSWAAFR